MMRNLVIPVPIPNTKVKQITADGTAGEALWESRWSPGQKTSFNMKSFFVLENPWLDQGFGKAFSYGTYNKNSF